jgi:hypothetical protein
MTPFRAILPDRDYLRDKKFGRKNHGPTQSRKAKEGKAQPETAGIL